MYNGGDGKWIHIQDIVELRCGRPGPKKSADPLNDVRDMEAMTSDNTAKTGMNDLNYNFATQSKISFTVTILGGHRLRKIFY